MSIQYIERMNPLCMIREEPTRTGLTVTAYLESTAIADAARAMLDGGYHLEDISALHAREGFIISYFFEHTGKPGRIALRLLTAHDSPSVPSISSIYPGADWHEREANDFYGIRFEGHPNPVRLLLPSDMDSYPLRKEETARAPVRVLCPCTPEALYMKKENFTLLDPEPEKTDEKSPADQTGHAISKD